MKVDGEVPEGLRGQRLDRVVAMMTGASRALAADWVREGYVQVNGSVCTQRAMRLDTAMRVEVDQPAAVDTRPQPDPTVEFRVVYEDTDIVVVDKPAGLVVHPGAGHVHGTLVSGLLARYPEIVDVGDEFRPGIVHRLDLGTSGLMVVARSHTAYERLVTALAERNVHREYVALVHGKPRAARGVVDAPIGRSHRDPTAMAVTDRGKPARTHYEVLREFDTPIEATSLRCVLETGRTHQIRVHLAAIGHPVLGDIRYGGSQNAVRIARPFLHAKALAFTHPMTNESVSFTADLPPDLTAVQSQFRSTGPASSA